MCRLFTSIIIQRCVSGNNVETSLGRCFPDDVSRLNFLMKRSSVPCVCVLCSLKGWRDLKLWAAPRLPSCHQNVPISMLCLKPFEANEVPVTHSGLGCVLLP